MNCFPTNGHAWHRSYPCSSLKRILQIILLSVVTHSVLAATYYIDWANGDDKNSGSSKTMPWKRHPYMQGWDGKYVHTAGDQFIFKGGVTWPSSCFGLSITASGAPGKVDYYGVDQTWFMGDAWSRPVFDGEHVGPVGNHLVSMAGRTHITIDGIEFKRHMAMANFPNASIFIYDSADVTITNCFVHDWRLHASIADDDAHGGIIGLFGSWGITNVVVTHTRISNAENSGRQNGVAIRQVGTVAHCTIHDVQTAILFAGDIHHNEFYNIDYGAGRGFDGKYHSNLAYIDNWNGRKQITTPAYFHNNRVYNWGGGAAPVYPNPGAHDATIYVFNNLIYGQMSVQKPIQIDPYAYGATGDRGTVYVFNNTIVPFEKNSPAIRVVDRSSMNVRLKKLVAFNNHIIGDGAYVYGGPVAQAEVFTNLVQTPQTASGQGYLVANSYAPPSQSSATVDQGSGVFEGAFLFDFDFNGSKRSGQGKAWDIGAYEFITSGTVAPSPAGGLDFRGDSGQLTAPFVLEGTIVYQPIETGLAESGRAEYVFEIETAGDYIINALVNAADNSMNSFYVNVDSDPTDPFMVWHVPVTLGFEWRVVSWQGTGSWDNPDFARTVFTLSRGAHRLILRGRERETRIDRIRIVRIPTAPGNLRLANNP